MNFDINDIFTGQSLDGDIASFARDAADDQERERARRKEQRIEDLYGPDGLMARRQVSRFTGSNDSED